MVQTPWRQFRAPNAAQQYVVLASFLPLAKLRTVLRFFRYSSAISRQLERTGGVLGYSLRAKPLQRRFWTLSAWESNEALMAFVRTVPHADVMKALEGRMRPPKFLQWRVAGSDLPPSWDEALRRLQAP